MGGGGTSFRRDETRRTHDGRCRVWSCGVIMAEALGAGCNPLGRRRYLLAAAPGQAGAKGKSPFHDAGHTGRRELGAEMPGAGSLG